MNSIKNNYEISNLIKHYNFGVGRVDICDCLKESES
jgi:hypothetical protein